MADNTNNKRRIVICGKGGGGQAESVEWDDILNKPEFATVATTGDYDDLTDKPTILTQWFGTQAEYDAIAEKDPNTVYNIEGSDNVQPDWNQNDTTADDYIKNKPTIPAAQVNADWNSNSGVAQILNKPTLATVATSGDYNDLSNKPTIPAAPVQSNWNESDSASLAYIQNKPTIPVVNNKYDIATKTQAELVDFYTNYATIMDDYDLYYGEYPIAAVGTTQMQGITFVLVEYNQFALTSYALGGTYHTLTAGAQLIAPDGTITPFGATMKMADADSLATVATTGSYNDLSNKPTIPAAQVNADWNANSGVSQILNKPTLATVATTGNYSDLNGTPTIPAAPVQSDWNEADNTSLAYIQNKPTIPTVPPMTTETLTFTLQGGTTKTIEFYTKPMSANYFFVQDLSGMSNDVTIMCGDMIPNFDIYTSTDQTNWNYLGTTGDFVTLTETIPLNGKLYFKAVTDHWSGGAIQISCLDSHKIGGNIMSLLYGDNYFDTTLHPDYNINAFSGLFMNDSELVDASDLVLPSNVVLGCHQHMFSGCTSLTAAPELPATTLADYCYQNMFDGCTSLTAAPELPATTLADYCYQNMFDGCTALNKVTTYAQDISATDCLYYWLSGVSQTGDFYNLGGATYPSGANGIPTGWTEHNSL